MKTIKRKEKLRWEKRSLSLVKVKPMRSPLRYAQGKNAEIKRMLKILENVYS